MKLDQLLDALFPSGHDVRAEGVVVSGIATVGGTSVAVIGTTDSAFVGLEEILALGDKLEAVINTMPGAPVVMLVDNSGQRMALREELLALPQYVANLVQLQDQARRAGHKLVAVVYGGAMAGGFIAWGMCADRIYATADAHTSVMSLKAIARVTHLEEAKLEELAKTVPVFAPGADNLYKMGGVHGVWKDDLAGNLEKALAEADARDDRAALGASRGGRTMARAVIDMVEKAEL